jgi:hypothetical protein
VVIVVPVEWMVVRLNSIGTMDLAFVSKERCHMRSRVCWIRTATTDSSNMKTTIPGTAANKDANDAPRPSLFHAATSFTVPGDHTLSATVYRNTVGVPTVASSSMLARQELQDYVHGLAKEEETDIVRFSVVTSRTPNSMLEPPGRFLRHNRLQHRLLEDQAILLMYLESSYKLQYVMALLLPLLHLLNTLDNGTGGTFNTSSPPQVPQVKPEEITANSGAKLYAVK